jgi:magnesium-transporting ATPase (P-type)
VTTAWATAAEPVVAEPTGAIDEVSHDGLTAAEVAQRRQAGKVNRSERRTSRSIGEIVRANVLTRFNAIISALAVVVLIFGSPIDALFAGVMVLNAVIGVVQEVRAKRSLDRLTILIAPRVLVVRDGAEQEVDPGELVIDDLVRLRSGDEVPVDGVVIDSDGLEVDESALTGEADAVVKDSGGEVLSGSAVVSGSALIKATRVGRDRWIEGLVAEAREFVLTHSELRVGVDRILTVIGWMIVPLGALSVWSQLRSDQEFDEAMVSSVAAIVGLIPQGLVLLVSMAMAVATLRLGRNQVVVQELHAVEGLARIDVLCVDKTGTLTTGQFELDDVVAFGDDLDSMRAGLGALVHAEASPTASSRVIAEAVSCPDGWQPVSQVAFSSARKWSATAFDGKGTWVMGAPEVLLDAVGSEADSAPRRRVSELAAEARRVLLVAHSDGTIDGQELPAGLAAVGLVVLVEQLRSDAGQIMAYFADQHVSVKIISGDSSETVSAVAGRLGIAGGDRHVDLRHVEDGAYDAMVEESIVFGRVRPEQKRDLVDALQRAGHTVAMTGDGVNDIPALKRADIGIAMNTATPATKSVAQLVLVDGRFDRLPSVVAEGRRVVANMERVSTLFITKTVYSVMFVLAIGISGSVFPFLPRHISLISEFTIGVPAFLLSFRAADQPTRPGYLRRVVRFAVPAGLIASAVVLATYWIARSPAVDATLAEARSVATISLAATALWILYRLIRPMDRYDACLLTGLATALCLIAVTDPGRRFYALDWPTGENLLVLGSITIVSIVMFEAVLAVLRRWDVRLLESEEGEPVEA